MAWSDVITQTASTRTRTSPWPRGGLAPPRSQNLRARCLITTTAPHASAPNQAVSGCKLAGAAGAVSRLRGYCVGNGYMDVDGDAESSGVPISDGENQAVNGRPGGQKTPEHLGCQHNGVESVAAASSRERQRPAPAGGRSRPRNNSVLMSRTFDDGNATGTRSRRGLRPRAWCGFSDVTQVR